MANSHCSCSIQALVALEHEVASIFFIISWIGCSLRTLTPSSNTGELPVGGTDTDKQKSSAQLACVSLSLGHLVAKL